MRVRLKFSKTGPLRYIGNLDLQTIWERAARRADVPLAYSHGFHPQPKIHIASPLPLGCSSRCELVDLRLDQDVELADLGQRMEAALPQGMKVLGIEAVDDNAPALQSILIAAVYDVTLPAGYGTDDLCRRIKELLSSARLTRERRGKTYDLRPLVEELVVKMDNSDGKPRLQMRLSAREGATGRPDEVLQALGVCLDEAQIERTNLIFQA